MLTIHKHTLGPGLNIIELPEDATVLDVQVQWEQPQMWTLLNTDKPKVGRRFIIKGTGHEIDVESEGLDHCGTFQINGGTLVWHVFELIRKEAD